MVQAGPYFRLASQQPIVGSDERLAGGSGWACRSLSGIPRRVALAVASGVGANFRSFQRGNVVKTMGVKTMGTQLYFN
jgi:hypothetical protein